MSRELMQQALEALEWNYNTDLDNIYACEQWAKILKKNIAALREMLAQPEQEPVAWISESENLLSWDKFYDHMKPLYTAPKPVQQPLKLREIEKCIYDANNDLIVACRNVEAAHGITGDAYES